MPNLRIRWLVVIAFSASLWLLLLAGMALHETLERPSESYRTAVKWVSGLSIFFGAIILGASSYVGYMDWRG